jgi:ribosomal protein S18 acetylase RimI-like enzyme
MVNLRVQFDCSNIDWDRVSEILRTVGMASFEGKIHKRAFLKSQSVVFVFDSYQLIGFGRALSDKEYQAALYDLAILPEYQGKGIGRMIVHAIVQSLPNCNFILFAVPGKEGFYEKLNFRRMKTGMAFFLRASEMQQRGFIE